MQSVPPGRAARPLATSSVAPISMDMDAPCVLPRERASHPGDERYSAEPSYRSSRATSAAIRLASLSAPL